MPLNGKALEAIDGSLKTWWEIDGPLPASLEFTLDNLSELHAARLVWKDVGLDPLRGVKAGPFRYRLSVRVKGKWTVWIDASTNDNDLLVDYREKPAAVADALRLEVLSAPQGITPALDEFTVFGTAPEDFQ